MLCFQRMTHPAPRPSLPGLTRQSILLKDVDARDKPGHDGGGGLSVGVSTLGGLAGLVRRRHGSGARGLGGNACTVSGAHSRRQPVLPSQPAEFHPSQSICADARRAIALGSCPSWPGLSRPPMSSCRSDRSRFAPGSGSIRRRPALRPPHGWQGRHPAITGKERAPDHMRLPCHGRKVMYLIDKLAAEIVDAETSRRG